MCILLDLSNVSARPGSGSSSVEELGQPYETVWLDYGDAGTRSAKYLAVNPMGKLPAVVMGDQVITEAAAICLFLADAFPQAELRPLAEWRANYFRWTLFAAGPIDQAVTAKAIGWNPPDRARMLGFGTFDEAIGALTGHPEKNKYVCGDRFTAAGVHVGNTMNWGPLFKSIPTSQVLAAYSEPMMSRSAHERIRELNEARLAQTKK